MTDLICFDNEDGTQVKYWVIETQYKENLDEFFHENELDAVRKEYKNTVVYLMKDKEDYLLLNSLLKLLS